MKAMAGMLLAMALAACSSGGGGGGGSTRPPEIVPTTMAWQAVTLDTDERPIEDITGYEVSATNLAGETTTREVSADTRSVTMPLQSGGWTLSVRAISASRGLGEAATVTRVIQ